MNYHCPPDIDLSKALTPETIMMFERFPQDVDRTTIDNLVAAEVQRHVKLCELAILHYARMGCSWALLPDHPIQDIASIAFRQLYENGWKVKTESRIETHECVDPSDRTKKVTAQSVVHRYTVSWLTSDREDDAFSAEWQRREHLEADLMANHPWKPVSTVENGVILRSNTAWSSILDGKYLVEIQRHFFTNYLCIFELETGACLASEETDVDFGATFGPDSGDVAMWQARARELVDARH